MLIPGILPARLSCPLMTVPALAVGINTPTRYRESKSPAYTRKYADDTAFGKKKGGGDVPGEIGMVYGP